MSIPQEIITGQRDLLTRFLAKDPNCIKRAREYLISWGTPNVSVKTECVRLPRLNDHLKPYKEVFDTPEKLVIQPIGLNNMCHNNALYFSELNETFMPVLGYNVCSCPCGSVLCYEIHSVVRDMRTNTLYDITKDFGKEKEKWFIPLKVNFAANIWKWKELFERKYDLFHIGIQECKCNIRWGVNSPMMKGVFAKEFLRDVRRFNTMLDDAEAEEDDWAQFTKAVMAQGGIVYH
jgi:hypothetical protein